jgi:uncharacterized NAD(P)/FAD-binding protein YdhS
MSIPSIAVIGAGFSGTLLSLHLLRRCPPDTRIYLIERNKQFGRGQAYSTGNANHLLNVPAGRMSAFHGQPNDFISWLKAQSPKALDGCVPTETGFVPRRLFGAYVRHLLNEELKRPGDRYELVRGDVRGIDYDRDRLGLLFDRRHTLEVDFAVLAIGNFPPEPPTVTDPTFYDGSLYRPDPWAPNVLTDLDPLAPILLIGTGLTMVDTTISLLDQGHRGPIHALSRRGLLPHRHAATAVPASSSPRAFPTSLTALTRYLRAETAHAEAQGSTWHPVIDELRPFTTDVWQTMSIADRARFIRHLRPWWEIHRHRMPGPVADRIEAAKAMGQLRIHAGRIERFTEAEGEVEIVYRPRFTDGRASVRATRVVNCAGPGCDYERITHPLVRDLLAEGRVRPDPLRLGLDVSGTCALKDRDGTISRHLFAVGPVTRGAFWEMTAVPDIRRQCEFLATHLASLIKSAEKPVELASSRKT